MKAGGDAVLDAVAKVTGADRSALRPAMDLAGDLGIDSPKALEIVMEIEDRLGIEIPDEDAARMETLGDLLAYVEGRGE